MSAKFKLKNVNGRDYSGNIGTDVRKILTWALKYGGKMWTGFSCMCIETRGGRL
jgi:hypothetical protein